MESPMAWRSFTFASRDTHGRRSIGNLLPQTFNAEQFRSLALAAIDAARRAGAEFADIRIGVQREFTPYAANIGVGYGIRARIEGCWSFQHGNVLELDAVVGASRIAVANARASARVNKQRRRLDTVDMIPLSPVTGEWKSPVDIDPLAISLDDYRRFDSSLEEPVKRLGFVTATGGSGWHVETRVFASTVGSLITQEFTRGGISLNVAASAVDNVEDLVILDVPGLGIRSTGFETALASDYAERTLLTAEQAVRWRALPLRPFVDVGRFPVVFDGATMASVVGQTVDLAVDGDRLAGLEADASGMSFLAAGSQVFRTSSSLLSLLLTITSDHAVPSSVAVKWDDEGIATEPYVVVDRGRIVGCHTTWETMSLLTAWSRDRGISLRSHGGAVAPTPASLPLADGGNLGVAPGTSRTSIDDLFRDIDHGFLVIGGTAAAGSRLTTGVLRSSLVIEVRRGKPVARVPNICFVFSTLGVLGKGLLALGGAETMGTATSVTEKGIPWQTMTHPVSAPAAYCKEIDVANWNVGG